MIQTQFQSAVFQPSADKLVYWMVGDRVTVLISGEQTNGAYAVLEAYTVADGGPPLHIHHREDEIFSSSMATSLSSWVIKWLGRPPN